MQAGVLPPFPLRREHERCPHCGSRRFIRHGWFASTQRYRCKDCRRTFSRATLSLDKGIRFRRAFLSYLSHFGQPKPLRAEAKRFGVSVATVWRWRHRILAYLLEQAKANPKVMDGQIAFVLRSMSPMRSRWSSETDLLWWRRGEPLPKEMPKQEGHLTFVFAARVDGRGELGSRETHEPTAARAQRFENPVDLDSADQVQGGEPEETEEVARGVPFLCKVYGGPKSPQALGEALWPHMTKRARLFGLWGLIGRRMTRREQAAASPWAELYGELFPGVDPVELIPEDEECMGWEELSDWLRAGNKLASDVIQARFRASLVQTAFTAWMRRFRAVRLHYVEKYIEWFNRLLDVEIRRQGDGANVLFAL